MQNYGTVQVIIQSKLRAKAQVLEFGQLIFSGDMNLDAKLWDSPNYRFNDMANIVKDFMIEENCHQIIDEYTRIRTVDGNVQRSCLDHITVNCINKISNVEILGVGKSDHMGTLVTKMSREIRTSPRTIKKRVYKNFNTENFKTDILNAKESGKFDGMHVTNDIEVAGDIFTNIFNEILNLHAPIKTIQNRNNYVPYITDEIKELIDERNDLKKKAIITGQVTDYDDYKVKRNLVSTKLKDAKTNYYKSKFSDKNMSSCDLWRNVNTVLGNVRSQFPPQILINGKLLSKPRDMANAMNKFFIDKIATLKTNNNIIEENALQQLKYKIGLTNLPNEGFKLKEINTDVTLCWSYTVSKPLCSQCVKK